MSKLINKKYKKILTDFILNIVATSMPILVLQFVIYPLLSREISNSYFGIILTIVAIKNSISLITGNSLNNVRLIRESEKSKLKFNIDYNLLLLISQTFNVILISFLIYVYFDTLHYLDFAILFFIFVFSSIRIYASAFYRIKLEYKKIAVLSLINVIGMILGFLIHLFIVNSWTTIFLISEILSLIYIIKTTPILSETKSISKEFRNIAKDYFHLSSNAILSNGMAYLDRFLISPILGAEKVAIYYTATIISKSFALLFGPLNNVILTYAAKYKNKINKVLYYKYVIGIIATSIMQLIFIQILSKTITEFLYPQLFELSRHYILLASIGIIINMGGNSLRPLVMITSNLKWQPRINIIYASIFFPLASILTYKYGLYGFCYSSIIANSIQFILIFYIGHKGLNRNI